MITNPITADRVTDAMVGSEAHFVDAIGGIATLAHRGEAGLMITGAPIPTLNGVLTIRPSATVDDVRELLDIVARTNLPYSLVLRPGHGRDLVELAEQRGMTEDESIPLMAMSRDIERTRAMAQHPDLLIRVLDPQESGVHAVVAAEGFEAPVEVFEHLIPPALMLRPGLRAYVGTIDGENVTTAVGVLVDDSVGIFNVATRERHRGRGYGRAITARAVLDGFEAGAEFAYLQSSEMGYRIYEQIGFETLERWSSWLSADPSRS